MKTQGFFLLFAAAVFTSARGNPIETADNIPVQENFNETKLYGTWYDAAIGSTCGWMKKHKDRLSMGTLVIGPGKTSAEMSATSTRIRQGLCSAHTTDYQKTSVPGKFTAHNPKWGANIETYVVRTNYDEYAVFVMKKNTTYGLSTTARLYGRSPELREDLVAEFRQYALDLGIPEDSIFNLINKGQCQPGPATGEPQRMRRAALLDEEGSADGSLPTFGGNKEDHCLLPKDAGPCLGMLPRYFHNTTSETCEVFFYGGCLGNGNNFLSEKVCLQTCRTEAACRLPILPGGSCNAEFWGFDANQGKCITFRGCGGNANKFYLEKECKEYCGVLPDGEEEFLQLSRP
ncbi:protein AMBP isoform X2 [Hemicordylus capensis]|uniref:protein AMBP isoform X2 n=1 Tax=Hemicordylus capensis TaxID=884348 RepID=UPI002302B2FF|nr:protein AMBP isoform X2 [Hemicordylus capensis]